MPRILVAKETTVQKLNDSIGEYTDTASMDGTTVFAKIKYITESVMDLNGKLTSTRVSKIDSIGITDDSVSNNSLMGKTNNILSNLYPSIDNSTVRSTNVLVNTSISGDGTLVASFLAPYSRTYTLTCNLSSGASGTANIAYLVVAPQTINSVGEGVVIASRAGSAGTYTKYIYLNANTTYKFYIFGANNPTINSLQLEYINITEKLTTPYFKASVANSSNRLNTSTSSGTGTTPTPIVTWHVVYSGTFTLRLKRTVDSRFQLYKNNILDTTISASETVSTVDIVVNAGDELVLYAYAKAATADWSLTSVEMCYELIWLYNNTNLIIV